MAESVALCFGLNYGEATIIRRDVEFVFRLAFVFTKFGIKGVHTLISGSAWCVEYLGADRSLGVVAVDGGDRWDVVVGRFR